MTEKKGVHVLPPTIQSHSQSSSVQNSLSYGPKSFRSKFHLFRGVGDNQRGLYKTTNNAPDNERCCRFDRPPVTQWIWRNG